METREIVGLGTVTFDKGSIIKELEIELFETHYNINLRFQVYEKGFESMTTNLITIAKEYIENISLEMEKVAQEALNYYQSEVKEMAEEGYCDYVELNNMNDLKLMINPVELYFTEVHTGKPNAYVNYGILFDCKWSDEGFAISYGKDGNIAEVGTGDVLY